MKKVFLALVLVFGAAVALTAQQKEVFTGPAINLDKEVHDYGDIEYGGDGNCLFTVTNVGTEPLIISKCKGSCGCTVPQCDKNPIMPGATSDIKVKYDTKRPGAINKSVTITSNAVNEPSKVVRIKGRVAAQEGSGTPVKAPASGAPTNGK